MVKERTLGIKYHLKRKRAGALRFRFERRTREILEAIIKYQGTRVGNLLDVGCADGLMLKEFDQRLDISFSVGVDLSYELLKADPTLSARLVQGNALDLPFLGRRFDLVVTSAVIEHVSDAEKMLKACRRVLRKSGLCILTSPVPFWESVATKTGHLETEGHNKTFNLSELKLLFLSQGFDVLDIHKFMIFPIGFPFEEKIEYIVNLLRVGFLQLNQLMVARKLP